MNVTANRALPMVRHQMSFSFRYGTGGPQSFYMLMFLDDVTEELAGLDLFCLY